MFWSCRNRPCAFSIENATKPLRTADELYDIIPENHRQPYDVRKLLECLLDEGHLDEFQADYAKEMITGHARIGGMQVGVIANHRGMVRMPGGKPPRFGGIIYTESAEKVAYFIETCNRHQTPLLFVQDVSGFMVGPDAEHSGIIRAGATICGSNGDGNRAQNCFDCEPCVGRRLLRDGGTGISIRTSSSVGPPAAWA